MSNEEYLPIDPELEAILNGSAPVQMAKTVDQRIIDWNTSRNNLKLDFLLELHMLQEEAREFYTATSMAQRLQEYADFIFVYSGTRAKMNADCGFSSLAQFSSQFEAMSEIRAWADSTLNDIQELLVSELALLNIDEEQMGTLLSGSIRAVVAANEAKGAKKDGNGKVVKGENYVSPLEQIRKLIKETTGRTYQ